MRHLWVLREVFACPEDLTSPASSVEPRLSDREHVVGMCAVEALKLVGLSPQLQLQLTTALMIAVREQRIIHDPRPEELPAPASLLPEVRQGRQFSRAARRNAHS